MSAPALTSALDELKARAQAEFERAPMPSATEEAWRRTDAKAWGLAVLNGSVAAPEVSCVLPEDLAALGASWTDLDTAAARSPEDLRAVLESAVEPEYAKWELANRAFAVGGVLRVPRGAKCETPVHIVVRHPEGRSSFPRIIVKAGEGSEFTLLEEHMGGTEGRSAAVSQVQLEAGAKVRVFYVQETGPRSAHLWHQRCRLAAGAELFHLAIMLGGRVHKSQLDVELAGAGSRSRLYGILFGDGSQHFDAHTSQRHNAPHTASDLLFRSVLKDKARSIYTGLIRVEKEARGTEAYQSNHNLLLANTARADTTPILEILTDAVQCKHGATAGPLPEEELYYLATRGVAPGEAKKMLVMGFFEPVLSQLPEAARVGLAARVEARLENL